MDTGIQGAIALSRRYAHWTPASAIARVAITREAIFLKTGGCQAKEIALELFLVVKRKVEEGAGVYALEGGVRWCAGKEQAWTYWHSYVHQSQLGHGVLFDERENADLSVSLGVQEQANRARAAIGHRDPRRQTAPRIRLFEEQLMVWGDSGWDESRLWTEDRYACERNNGRKPRRMRNYSCRSQKAARMGEAV